PAVVRRGDESFEREVGPRSSTGPGVGAHHRPQRLAPRGRTLRRLRPRQTELERGGPGPRPGRRDGRIIKVLAPGAGVQEIPAAGRQHLPPPSPTPSEHTTVSKRPKLPRQ